MEATTETQTLGVWFNGQHWVVAENESVARDLLRDVLDTDEEEIEGDGWDRLPDDRKLRMDMQDGREPTRKTCAELVRDEGRGYLGGADW